MLHKKATKLCPAKLEDMGTTFENLADYFESFPDYYHRLRASCFIAFTGIDNTIVAELLREEERDEMLDTFYRTCDIILELSDLALVGDLQLLAKMLKEKAA
jgi:hypothetical protein